MSWRFVQFVALLLIITAGDCAFNAVYGQEQDQIIYVKKSAMAAYSKLFQDLQNQLDVLTDQLAKEQEKNKQLVKENAELRAGQTNTDGDVDPEDNEDGDPICNVPGYEIKWTIQTVDKCDDKYEAKLSKSQRHSSSVTLDGIEYDTSYYTDDNDGTETRSTNCRPHRIQVPVCRLTK